VGQVSVQHGQILWSVLVAGLVWVSGKYGTGSLTADLGLRFAPIDLVGIPLGVFCQLVLLQVVYWPLRSIWPATFDEGRIETSARNLYDSANGAWLVGLVLGTAFCMPQTPSAFFQTVHLNLELLSPCQ
jgi:hypothetical protein